MFSDINDSTALRALAEESPIEFLPGGQQAIVLRDRLSELPMPILVIWGAEDRILPVSHSQGLPLTSGPRFSQGAATWCTWRLRRRSTG